MATANPGLRVDILGVNRITSEVFNSFVAATPNILPWLQDTTAQSVWLNWGIAYRDVLILDAFNRPVARDNLTTHDLGVKANADALKAALLKVAIPADTDKDGLPDDWEYAWFGNLGPTPAGDDDADGFDNLHEFAFNTGPLEPASLPRITPQIARPGGSPALAITFRRFNSAVVDFVVETSSDLVTWTSAPASVNRVGDPVMLYNGIGGADTRYQQTSAAGALPSGFLRVRPVSRLTPP